MSLITRFLEKNSNKIVRCYSNQIRQLSSQSETQSVTQDSGDIDDEEFRVLNLRQAQTAVRRTKPKQKKEAVPPPRSTKMAVDQDWGAVWPGPRTFHPATVPLPIRQGFTEKNAPPPSKYANAELMKIPNFLHLTPPVIKKQCEELKKFCTPWPKGLETEDKWKKYFPIDLITSDYCYSSPSVRNPLARIVTVKFQLSNLKFNKHSRDKFLRLVGERYNPETDVLTILTDKCPTRKQNYDYAMYLITALYHESWITEPWESLKSEADMECFDFNTSESKIRAEDILSFSTYTNEEKSKLLENFGKALETLINEGENEYNLEKYGEAVLKLYGLDEESLKKIKSNKNKPNKNDSDVQDSTEVDAKIDDNKN